MKMESNLPEIAAFVGAFKIISAFKETGQKSVFLTDHCQFGLTVLKIGRSPNKGSLKRATREVEIQRSIDSIYYPKIYFFQELQNHQFAILEEHIESAPLSESHHLFTEPVDILNLLHHLVTGLKLLWDQRSYHRDLKPDNVLIRPDKTPAIIDLGIVLASDMTDITHPLALRGPCTPAYAAPEQLKNRRADIDHRTDQFILGIDVMELINGGIHPFEPSLLLDNEFDIPENIALGNWNKEKLDEIEYQKMKPLVTRLLAPEPYQRYSNVDKLISDIERCQRECK